MSENAEAKFPKELLAVMPAKSIADIQEAGRCLAFERATACAFHICRATEALMLDYYEHLAGSPWPTMRNYERAVELARGFRGEGPRAVATIAKA